MAAWLHGAAGLVLALLLSGCKREEDTAASKVETPPAPTEVTLQLADASAEAEHRQLIAAFEARHPDVKVRLLPVAKSPAAPFEGTPPDLLLVGDREVGVLAARGELAPMGARLERSRVLRERDFHAPAMEAFRLGGALTCLPRETSSLVVYWNRALFQRLGVPTPKPDWSWDEFRQAAQALTRDENGDGRVDVHGLAFEPSLSRLAPFLWQAGGDVVDDVQAPRRLELLGASSLEAQRFVLRLQRVFRVMPSREEAAAERPGARFAAGRLGMLLDTRRQVPVLRAVPGLDWDVAPLPRHRTVSTVLQSEAYCLTRASQAQDAAFRFVEFALGPVGAELSARHGRIVPSLRKVAESPAFLSPGEAPASARVFLDVIPAIRRLPTTAAWRTAEERADALVEEWLYAEPPGGTKLTEKDGPAARGAGKAGGSATARRGGARDEVSSLGHAVDEAARGLLAPEQPPTASP
ncbi:extracellular solute-binding protein [Myxococcus sp. 1LA]